MENGNFDNLIYLLEEADTIQQKVVYEVDDLLSYNLHNQISNMIDTIKELKDETEN